MNEVAVRVKSLLQPYAKKCVVKSESKTGIYLDCKSEWNGKPLFFAATRPGKAYISVHLFPVYMFPDLLIDISPALDARRQGKACFNFKKIDEPVLAELAKLIKRGWERYKKEGLV
jgi:hypothetical protein